MSLLAQTATEPPVFRTTTRLVQVNVVVHDRKGKPVSDLKKEDFAITEEGAAQQIAFFRVQNAGTLAIRPANLGKNTFSNALEQREGVPSQRFRNPAGPAEYLVERPLHCARASSNTCSKFSPGTALRCTR